MKRKLLWMSLLLLILAGCSSDDDETVDGIVCMGGGVVYDGYLYQQIDETNPLSVFFGAELHQPRWDQYGNEHKSFFEQGEWNDESVLVINSREEFQKAYMGMKELPDVDFNQFTLVIGKTWGNDGSYGLSNVVLRDMGLTYELETQLIHHINRAAFDAIQPIFYWRLYSKLSKKAMIIKRTVTDVYD